MDHWNNKSLVRAMGIESFKRFKSLTYKLTNAEYSSNFYNDFLLLSDFCPSEFTKVNKPKMEVEGNKNYYTETRLTKFELGIENSVKSCIEKVAQSLLQHFLGYLDV